MIPTNCTILGLVLSSINSSPYAIISTQTHQSFFEVESSYFYNFYSHFIYTSTYQRRTKIVNTKFQNFISNALSFGSNDVYSKQCPSTNEETIKNCYYMNTSFPLNSKEARPYFTGSPNTLIIAGCLFSHLHDWQKDSPNENVRRGGGALYVCQKANVTLHENIFHDCASDFDGGAAFIVNEPSYSNNRVDLRNGQVPKVDIQYCCFSKCYSYNKVDSFGSAIYIAAEDATVLFTSTVDCVSDNEQHGAIFDIQSNKDVFSSNVNITKSNSKYCGGIEYRYATNGYFKFQTMIQLNSRYGTSFSSVNIDGIVISNCNYFNNTLKTQLWNNPVPALIHTRDKNIYITEFYFVATHFSDNTGRYGSKNKNGIIITFFDCYFEAVQEDGRTNDCELKECKVNIPEGQVTTCGIAQLNLYHCQGNQTAATLVITSLFTPSDYFTKSNEFTSSRSFPLSNTFKSTSRFSKSLSFTQSDSFTETATYTKSNAFSISKEFSRSQDFTNSVRFSRSNSFSSSGIFEQSEIFSLSHVFSLSDSYTLSNSFTNSPHFSTSSVFTNSQLFSATHIFTSSYNFSESQRFSESLWFSYSNFFSFSHIFTYSLIFMASKAFDETHIFTSSLLFSDTSFFTKSSLFTNSNLFTESNQFSFSKLFTHSLIFTASNNFNATSTFTSSNRFSESDSFSQSNVFPSSSLFSSSKLFTSSNSFTETPLFTKSTEFTSSSSFSLSNQFTKSLSFTPSKHFTNSMIFPPSKDFDATKEFTSSSTFSFSNMFTNSNTYTIIASINIDEPTNDSNKSHAKTILIVVSASACVAVASGVATYFIFRKKEIISDAMIEVKSTNEEQTNENPLYDLMDESDPFNNDFQNH